MIGIGPSFVDFRINIQVRQPENNSSIPTVFTFRPNIFYCVVSSSKALILQFTNMIKQTTAKHSGSIIRSVKARIGWLRSWEDAMEI